MDNAQKQRKVFFIKNRTMYNVQKQRKVFLDKTGRWIMSRNIIFVLMYHCHKLLDLIYNGVFHTVDYRFTERLLCG
jgi:hypothetical protein